MANEFTIIELLGDGGDPMNYGCAAGTAILKGTLAELDSDRTVIANTNDNNPVVGVTAMDKAVEESITISVYTNGVWDCLTDAGSDAAGVLLANSATENTLQTADAADLLSGAYVGHLLEAAGNAEVCAVRILK